MKIFFMALTAIYGLFWLVFGLNGFLHFFAVAGDGRNGFCAAGHAKVRALAAGGVVGHGQFLIHRQRAVFDRFKNKISRHDFGC